MKTNRVIMLFLAVLGVTLVQNAQAFYNPSTGRWLSRDPIGIRGGLNLYGFVANCPTIAVDPYGQCGCKCLRVHVTYEPGGDTMELNWYTDPQTGRLRFGNQVHVVWEVDGDKDKCRYYQDESNLTYDKTSPDGSVYHIQGINNPSTEDNYDDLGFSPTQDGYYLFDLHWDVTFRCISSDSSTPPVEKHDGLWWFLVRVHNPPL